MSKVRARLLPLSMHALMLGIWLTLPGAGSAQPLTPSVIVEKLLCTAQPCAGSATSVGTNVPIYYQITLANTTQTASGVNIAENFPPGFIFGSMNCLSASGSIPLTPNPPLVPAAGGATSFGPITLPPGTGSAPGPGVTCVIMGSFAQVQNGTNSASNKAIVVSAANVGTVLGTSAMNATVNPNLPLPTDLTISKSASTSSIDVSGGPVTVTYTVTITNNGTSGVFLGPNFQVQDQVSIPGTGVPLSATYGSSTCTATAGSDCLSTTPVVNSGNVKVDSTSGKNLVSFGFGSSAGYLAPGGSVTLSFTVTIADYNEYQCIKLQGGDKLLNSVHIVFNVGGSAVAVSDTNPANNTASAEIQVTTSGGAAAIAYDDDNAQGGQNPYVNPDCSKVFKVHKALLTQQPPGGFPWGSTLEYVIEIENVSIVPVTNVKLYDFVKEGLGTPSFTATVVSIHSCAPAPWCSTFTTAPTHNFTAYFESFQMFSNTGITIPAHSTIAFKVSIKYDHPSCEAYPAISPQPVFNWVTAHVDFEVKPGDPPQFADGSSEEIVAYMAPTPRCPLEVTKKLDGSQTDVAFNDRIDYTVTFSNNGAAAISVGTMIDVLRITVPNYAVGLQVDYKFSCEQTAGATPVTGYSSPGAPFPISGTGTVMVSYTSLPQQGVKIIANTVPVEFPPGATITCKISIEVHRPLGSDPYCSTVASLQNSGVMDVSTSYNSNLPWPAGTEPGNWATVQQPLPKCYDLVINKRVVQPAAPAWTSQNGGPVIYELTITNYGDPILPGTVVPVANDVFNPYYPGAPVGAPTCVPATPSCSASWSPAPPASPSGLRVNALAKGQTVVVQFSLIGPYTQNSPPSWICNDADIKWGRGPDGEGYWKHEDTLHARTCVPVFDVTSLVVTKLTAGHMDVGTVPPATYTVFVSCSLNGINYGPNTTLTFSVPPPNPPSQTVPTIPDGSTCKITEQTFSAAPFETACATGFGTWSGPIYPNVPNNNSQTTNVHVGANNELKVLNTFACVPPADLEVRKTVTSIAPAVAPPTTFTVDVSCKLNGIPTWQPNPFVLPYPPSPSSHTVGNLPTQAICNALERPFTMRVATSSCPSGYGVWRTPTYVNDGLALRASAPNVINRIEVRNVFECEPVATLTIRKIMEPGSVVLPQGAKFPVEVSCPPAILTTVNLIPGSTPPLQQTVPNIVVGTVCTITEKAAIGTDSLLQPGCQWITSYPNGQNVPVPAGGATLVVTNKLECKSPLDVIKRVESIAPAVAPPTTFTVDVACTLNGQPSGPNTTLTFQYPPDYVTLQVPNIPLGSICRIVEKPFPMGPFADAGCPSGYASWGPITYPNLVGPDATTQSVGIVNHDINRINVRNIYACIPTGEVGAFKVFDPPSLASTLPPGATFPVELACTPGPTTMLYLTAGNGWAQSVSNLPVGIPCRITEKPPTGTGIQSNCHWETSYPKGQDGTVPQGSGRFAVQNRIVCVGSLTVYKTFNPPSLASTMPPSAIFPVQVVCTPSPTTILYLTAANQFHLQLPNIPEGANCRIAELTPQNVPPLQPGCSWSFAYPKGEELNNLHGDGSLQVENSVGCSPTTLVTVRKTFDPPSLAATLPAGATFPVQVTCLPGPNPLLPLTPSQPDMSVNNVPVDSICFIDEQTSIGTNIGVNCHWETTYPQGQRLKITQKGPNILVAQNKVVCGPSGAVTLQKTIIRDTLDNTTKDMGLFTVELSCTNPTATYTTYLFFGQQYQATVTGIAAGSQCTVNEILPPQTTTVFPPDCFWIASYTPTDQQVTIQDGVNQVVQIRNELVCTGTPQTTTLLHIQKMEMVNGIYRPLGGTFVVQWMCAPSNQSGQATLGPGNYSVFPSVPVGDTCQVTETSTSGVAGFPQCQWTTTYFNDHGSSTFVSTGSTIQVVHSGHNRVLVINSTNCPIPLIVHQPHGPTPLPQPVSCRSPHIPNAAGTACACPAGTVARGQGCIRPIECRSPLVLNSAGNACVCPEGLRQVDGRCLPPVDCRAPFVRNPAGSACVCPAGSRQVGRECIKPVECHGPMIANRTGTACVCPPGTRQRGQECEKLLECRGPMVENRTGTACVCPEGTEQRGSNCVKPLECRDPKIKNRAGTACVCPPEALERGHDCVKPTVCKRPARPDRTGTTCVCPPGMTLDDDTCVRRSRDDDRDNGPRGPQGRR